MLSCSSNTFDSQEELLSHINDLDNNYSQEKVINGVKFKLTYKPTDLMISQELGESGSQDEINKLKSHYEKYLYFNIGMSKNNRELLSTVPKSRQEFGSLTNQLIFGMQQKIHLFTEEKDTLHMIDYTYPRLFGISKSTSLLLVYPRDESLTETDFLNLTIEDIGLFTGEVKFKILAKLLRNEPKLAFKID